MNIKSLRIAVIAFLTAMGSMATSAQNLNIEKLAGDNSLIRIAPEVKEKYLLLPIEEGALKSHIEVVAGNNQQCTFFVCIAPTKAFE